MGTFTIHGDLVEYNYAEQLMMASKARPFGVEVALSTILSTDGPREQKRHGGQVCYFDYDFRQRGCEHVVLRGNLAKFSQNEEMSLTLVQTGQRRLAEARPHDELLGIG